MLLRGSPTKHYFTTPTYLIAGVLSPKHPALAYLPFLRPDYSYQSDHIFISSRNYNPSVMYEQLQGFYDHIPLALRQRLGDHYAHFSKDTPRFGTVSTIEPKLTFSYSLNNEQLRQLLFFVLSEFALEHQVSTLPHTLYLYQQLIQGLYPSLWRYVLRLEHDLKLNRGKDTPKKERLRAAMRQLQGPTHAFADALMEAGNSIYFTRSNEEPLHSLVVTSALRRVDRELRKHLQHVTMFPTLFEETMTSLGAPAKLHYHPMDEPFDALTERVVSELSVGEHAS
jgi:hypothetical protein